MGQTEDRQTDGRIAVSLNALLGRGLKSADGPARRNGSRVVNRNVCRLSVISWRQSSVDVDNTVDVSWRNFYPRHAKLARY